MQIIKSLTPQEDAAESETDRARPIYAVYTYSSKEQ